MIELCVDEGGSGSTLIVSAQVFSRKNAEKLCKRWDEELRKYGVKHFHSKDYTNIRGGVFRGLAKSKRKELFARLVMLVHKFAHFGVTIAVDTDFYDREVPADCKSQWTSAYTFAVSMALGLAYVALTREKRSSEGINILVAKGHRNLAQATQRLEEFRLHNKVVVPVKTWSCGEMSDHPTLQAADVLAYASWQWISNRYGDIFHAIRPRSGSRYRVHFLQCDSELIDQLKHGWNETIEKKNAWGRRLQKS
jgi:hypothetical protein